MIRQAMTIPGETVAIASPDLEMARRNLVMSVQARTIAGERVAIVSPAIEKARRVVAIASPDVEMARRTITLAAPDLETARPTITIASSANSRGARGVAVVEARGEEFAPPGTIFTR